MPAQYTEVTLEDMEQFLKRAFRALRPKEGRTPKGEIYFDLFLSDDVVVRVWSSIYRGVSRGAGQDMIRVQLLNLKAERERHSTASTVRRTQNWRNGLQDRVEDMLEKYEDEEAYWENTVKAPSREETLAPPPDGVKGPPPSESQVAYALKLIKGAPSDFDWSQFGFSGPPDEEGVKSLSGKSVSKMIDLLKTSGPPAVHGGPVGVASFTKLRSGDWGLRGRGFNEGDSVTVTKRDGSKAVLQVGKIVYRAPDGSVIAEIDKSSRRYASDLDESPEDLYYGSVPS